MTADHEVTMKTVFRKTLSSSFRCPSCYRTLLYCVFLTVLFTCQLTSGTYLNKIAVHVKGGRSAVDRLADKHDCTNFGQIGNLDDHYLLEHKHIEERYHKPNHHHLKRLAQEPEIIWFEQQREKKRVKRDLTFNDQLWNNEWYLHGGGRKGPSGTPKYDMGVKGAWQLGFTGRGIVVTILDDGIERDHPDLLQNYDPYASTDINDHDSDPMPRYDFTNENRHGTRCAGEVAAVANNSNCVVGVAYHASIGGVRMLDGSVYDKVESDSLSHNHTHIDIYSASWGPDDDGRVVDGPGPLAVKSFEKGIKTGRRGKGNIFMWASGNGGRADDSCSCDGYTNSIYTLSISSTSERGRKPWYLEECSSTLATTYSSGAADERQIITTDLHKKCTTTHTGTSASAPLAAGLVALALEANPSLTWRDVQYITLLSANPEPMDDGDWKTNGMNRKVSLKYGYGLMNATKMVQYALKWTTVPQQHICIVEGHKKNIPLYEFQPYLDNVTTNGCSGQANEVRYLEHVHIRITLNYKRRGDLTINIRSPSGTNSTLLPKRNRDVNQGGFNDWAFLSVHFWEENPTGDWKLSIVDKWNPFGSTIQKGIIKSWSLVLYGTKEQPINLRNGPVQPTVTSTSRPYTCDEQCIDTCSGPGPEHCDRCKYFQIQNGGCVQSCPRGYRSDRSICVPCSRHCDDCITQFEHQEQCQKCSPGYKLMDNNRRCVSACPNGTFFSKAHNLCYSCSQQCEECEGQSDFCTSCSAKMSLQNNQCVLPTKICPEGQYQDPAGICQLCDSGCHICNGPGNCVHCLSKASYIESGYCVSNCSAGYLPHILRIAFDGFRIECRKCNQGVCNSCINGFKMKNSKCVQVNACSSDQFYDWPSMSCKRCHKNCDTCHGPLGTDCNSCKDPWMFHPLLQACLPCCVANQPEGACCNCDLNTRKCIVGNKRKEGEEMANTGVILISILAVIAVVIILLSIFICLMLRSKNISYRKMNAELAGNSPSVRYEKLNTNEI